MKDKLYNIFGIQVDDEKLFFSALTHPSYTQENNFDYCSCYERLEFLGDAVLKMSVSDILYKMYPNFTEGQMSKIRSIIVSDAVLSEVCNEIGLSELIILAKNEEKHGCRKLESVCACAFEAVLGAYYLDGKYDLLLKFIESKFSSRIKDIENNFDKYNAKAILQEYTQSVSKETPLYKTLNESGPAHKKMFEVEVKYRDLSAFGIGKTKKEAEQQAAYEACIKLGVIKCQK